METQVTTPAPAAPQSTLTERLMSLDTYRGLVMMLLAFAAAHEHSGLWFAPIREKYPQMTWLDFHFDHPAWGVGGLWDLIQPSFMFMVGVSMAYSYASRARRGQSYGRMFGHAVYRAVVLILLGVFLRSLHEEGTYWTLEDVISQIGLGYVFLFLLWNRAWWVQLLAATVILIAYWGLFALSPPGDSTEEQDQYTGFYAHWNKVDNPAHKADKWLLNLFPLNEKPHPNEARDEENRFLANKGGYYTLNFIPSLATMIFGLMAGEWLRCSYSNWKRFGGLVLAGAGMLLLGLALDRFGVCPIVKRIWTPSFAIYTAGWCLLILGALYCIIDIIGFKIWAWPFMVVGKNSIAMYVMTYIVAVWVLDQLRIHIGERPFQVFGTEYQMLMENLTVAAILWLICFWMYRRRIFLRI